MISSAMKIPSNDELESVLSWFNSLSEVLYWGGPDLSYPLYLERFKTESNYHKINSYILKVDSTVVAFGQIYQRLNRCHLGRLVVNPDFRGQGFGQALIEALSVKGRKLFGLKQDSLFVLDDNSAALSLYKKSGFRLATYPVELKLANCLYMIRD